MLRRSKIPNAIKKKKVGQDEKWKHTDLATGTQSYLRDVVKHFNMSLTIWLGKKSLLSLEEAECQ